MPIVKSVAVLNVPVVENVAFLKNTSLCFFISFELSLASYRARQRFTRFHNLIQSSIKYSADAILENVIFVLSLDVIGN